MNAKILSLLLLCSVLELSLVSARPKTLKIIIPSKIRYVHHHHTHVVVMKDKKAQKAPTAKVHHLHYYDDPGRRNKGVHHYFIPVVQPPVEDEAEDESVAKYSVAPPKGRYPNPDYVTARQLSPVYEEPVYPTYSQKYRVYERSSDPGYSPTREPVEYHEAGPFFPVVGKRLPYKKSGSGKVPAVDFAYKRDYADLEPDYSGEQPYEEEPLYYPEGRFYPKRKKRLFIK